MNFFFFCLGCARLDGNSHLCCRVGEPIIYKPVEMCNKLCIVNATPDTTNDDDDA
jgi:hypothetical protein